MNMDFKFTKLIKNISSKFLAFVLICAMLFSLGFTDNNIAYAAASSSTTSTTTRVSVHDPSIFYDSATNKYYIFGSHLGQASSTDLRNWSYLGTQGYTNTSLYGAPTFEGYYYIKNKNSSLYLDITDGSNADGAKIRQWTYNGSEAQKFKIVYYGSGYYYILTGASAYASCVDITDGSTADGANVIQWKYWGGTPQLYKIQQNSDGTVSFLTKGTNGASALDVFEGSTTAGGNICQWSFWGGEMQKWELVKAGGTGNPSRNTNAPLISALSTSFGWAGYNDQDSSGGTAVWAPDPIYNPSYVWADGSKGAYMMYYCTSSTYIRSCIGYAVSKSVTGPYQYVDTVIYSGFTSSDNNVTTTSSLGTKTVNTSYKNTNIPELIDKGILTGTRSGWFNNGAYNNSLFPNAIDPTLVFDKSGKLWMTYGSWSGGIYILQIDTATGQPIYPRTSSGNTDGYFGTRIAGGYGKSGEAPYIVYDSASGYYYLYVTYGWLGKDGGYHIRLYRSSTINGNYVDAAGNSAIFTSSTNQANIGIKLFGNYKFSSIPTGYKSGGHNSAFIDTDGQRYLVYHTRFNNGTEMHEVRVHQQFLNADKWPVTAVYEYLGSTISSTGYSTSDMCGTYQFINMGKDATTANVGMLTTQSVTLNSNGTITGSVTGTWSYTSGSYYCSMVIGGVTYKGVFFKQKDESSSHTSVMTFSLIGTNNQSIWGSK
ncbi:RICIN domain-containing protein [Clostridium cellulovorans]|uniref:Glycoside hydrolase family 43 n=2 Tax=Clostridium cellulovorans TaxID=1493 RepID=D9SQS6_CLOC7|nr:RICIN domain-containing protein [Clostridium cellulovorans]ADL52282.1 glycoside hydrolase family 43 [Clostridium cellulovorans 743B]BAV13132.1 endo-arabinase-like protein [Clostridium cellulovorans]